jgi:hypothetical protein
MERHDVALCQAFVSVLPEQLELALSRQGAKTMMQPKVDRELECVKVLAGLDDIEDRLYVYTPSYRTPEGLPPDYEMEAVLEICPETSGKFDIPVLPYAVHPLPARHDVDNASPGRNAEAIRAKLHRLERLNESDWFRFLQTIREEVLTKRGFGFREFIPEN